MTKTVELLVFATDADAAAGLLAMLADEGYRVDLATECSVAQGLFLDRGGHALLVLTPDVGTGRATQVIQALRAVDAELPVVVFGAETLRETKFGNVHRIRSFHPASRAGVGALRQVLCGLPRS
jgi:DNA-binding response OmpR family regulator